MAKTAKIRKESKGEKIVKNAKAGKRLKGAKGAKNAEKKKLVNTVSECSGILKIIQEKLMKSAGRK